MQYFKQYMFIVLVAVGYVTMVGASLAVEKGLFSEFDVAPIVEASSE